jgi:tetratricopeptide (TPR) repeat protein
MSTNKNDQVHEDNFENLEEALSRTEQYIEKNQKKLTFIALVIIVVAVGIFSYQKYYKAPMELNAQAEMFQAQRYFEVDSFNLAINGDGNYDGFLDIIDNFGSTEAGNLSAYYTGISYLHLGEYQNAINYLEDFSSSDFILSTLAKAAIGDAYMELGNNEKAASSYMSASTVNTNNFTTPIYLQKAGIAFELTGNYKDALAAYETIEKDFKKSSEARDIEKYITRAKLNLK